MPESRGGSRPGAGRKPKSIEEARRNNALALIAGLTDEARGIALQEWMRKFQSGDRDALWMVPYLFGQPPKAPETDDGKRQPITLVFTPLDNRD